MPERHGEQIVATTTEAREGVTGHNVRYVLVWSTVGMIVAFVIVYFFFFR
jgi:acid phosphatase family membrane protein YuiD